MRFDYEGGGIVEAGCWSHARRKLWDIHERQHRLPGTLAHEGLQRIGRLFAARALAGAAGARRLGAGAGAESIVTGSIAAAAVATRESRWGSHLRITLALMPWLRAMAETEAPGERHWATTSRLNWRG